jgi:hypothetical protein
LIDWAKETLKELVDAILNWMWERIKDMMNFALSPIIKAIVSWQNGINRAVENAESEYETDGEISEETSDDLIHYLYGLLYYTIDCIAGVITAALILFEIITLGAGTALSAFTSVIINILLMIASGLAFSVLMDWTMGTDAPILSAGEKALDFYNERTNEQNVNVGVFNIILGFYSVKFSLASWAMSDTTGLTPAAI